MSATPTHEQTPRSQHVGRNPLSLWIGGLIVGIAVAGIVGWLVFSGGAEESTLAFDGETAIYSGPETIQAGDEVTITLVNNSDEPVKFVWVRLDDEHAAMTLSEVGAALQAGKDVTADGRKIGPQRGVPAHEHLDTEYRLPVEGTHFLGAEVGHTDEQGLYENVFYPAVIIEVTGD